MPSWEQWHSMQTEEATTYGKLKTLEIFNCPKLVGDLPRFFPSLADIRIEGDKKCELLSLPRSCIRKMSSHHLENLIMDVSSTLPPLYPPLQKLQLLSCGSSFRSLHMDLFPNLKTLSIGNNHYFEALSMSDGKSLEELTYLLIEHCGSFVSFPNGGLIAPKLSEFVIRNCSKLKWLPKKMTSLSALNEFEVIGCLLMEPFPEGEDEGEGGLPVSLSRLRISYDVLLKMKWNWQTLPHLTILHILGNREDMEPFPEEGLLPTTITSLSIMSFAKLKILDKNGLRQLTSLKTLEILDCPELETLSEEGFPTSLTSLEIDDCPLVKKKYDPEESGNEEYWTNISHIPNVQFGLDFTEDSCFSSVIQSMKEFIKNQTSIADDRGDFTT
ncbi:hypothetical protein CsatA_027042 [Cannabis sativa]